MLTNKTIHDKITNVLADLVKWLTHWIVVPTYVGSIPTFRPIKDLSIVQCLNKNIIKILVDCINILRKHVMRVFFLV